MSKRVFNTNNRIQYENNPTIIKTVHRNQSVEYYPKEETFPPMIVDVMMISTRRFWKSELKQLTILNDLVWRILFRFPSNFYVPLLVQYRENEPATPAAILESTLLKLSSQQRQ